MTRGRPGSTSPMVWRCQMKASDSGPLSQESSMKLIHFAAILVVLVGCGGSGQQSASKSGYEEPTIKFVDLSLGPQIPRSRGLEFTLNCGLRIRNPNSFPIHARQLRVTLNGTVKLEMDQTSR